MEVLQLSKIAQPEVIVEIYYQKNNGEDIRQVLESTLISFLESEVKKLCCQAT